ncbi:MULTISPECIES: sigma-70 family RNA polymerase sigma factor [unclassified Acetobacterium]|jgi:RNA polymerase sigma factor for flagellar operon FliA|uniref:sigma-70 family RNA polymerase sigma factor n=1 Tax=unclassified Acetobacterium TaxID=2638182 RepID=UPI000DBEB3CD|nr:MULTISPECIES: FliA/WhiG family RNA polymerase sigma factor [unclassified Acetobacterium]AWW26412.1 FliA/WhiG family RNA polymerase sigma factor [Acetobacterium sp. KB-1]MDZ5724880.1 FliA/WhiG family RNA polymerase sigma factor [Acetobacterium sp. K1/6]
MNVAEKNNEDKSLETKPDKQPREKTLEEKKTEEKIMVLWQLYKEQRTTEVRNEIVLQYTGLVKKIVLRFKGSYNNFGQLDDMVNQGMIVLIDAVEKFNPDLGNKFETFATLKIRGSVVDFMRKQDWVPRSQRSLSKVLEETYGELYASLEREPSEAEIAAKMGISEANLQKILQQRHNAIVLSYEEAINEKMMEVSPLITEEKSDDSPESRMLYNELKEKLGEAVDQLKEKERLVVSLYYYENLKLKEIAEVLGVTESRVSQIHSQAMIKMRNRLKNY